MATFSASATVALQVSATYTKTTPLASASLSPKFTVSVNLSTTDISKMYQNSYSAQSSPVTLDLTSLTDDYGQSISFGSLKGAWIYNTDNTATLVVGGGTNPALGTDQYTITPGKLLPITSVFTVDGTHKNLVLTPSASMSFQLILVGS